MLYLSRLPYLHATHICLITAPYLPPAPARRPARHELRQEAAAESPGGPRWAQQGGTFMGPS